MTILLQTERLVLRHFVEADADHLLELDSDPEVIRYAGPRLADREAYRQRILQRFFPYYGRHKRFGFWAVEQRGTGEFLGWYHLRPALDYIFAAEAGYRPGDYDLGYRFRRSAWGKGLATEGGRALVQMGFAEPEVQRVVSCALCGNIASTRVMEKCGLKKIRDFAMPGYAEAVVYAIERSEFLAML